MLFEYVKISCTILKFSKNILEKNAYYMEFGAN